MAQALSLSMQDMPELEEDLTRAVEESEVVQALHLSCHHDDLDAYPLNKTVARELYAEGYKEVRQPKDGNCQPRSLAHSYNTLRDSAEITHVALRSSLTQALRARRAMYENFVDGDFDVYVQAMSQDGTWGDNVTLQVFADEYRVHVKVFQDRRDLPVHSLQPTGCDDAPSSANVVAVTYYNNHYNAAVPGVQAQMPEESEDEAAAQPTAEVDIAIQEALFMSLGTSHYVSHLA
eukprot:TRINITY_DN1306_c0_g1_i5.p1 TRINITY_DN1306_c0_g1~~TRINITY_DN1306_c0_g1_i5.p1  ORF type:complete len:234 (-),score=41.38 TRINITY_DN1306_c0_g1_i5:217-918(-)